MHKLLTALCQDDAGFIVSAELVLIATISVLGLLVGLSEVAININHELEDVGSAFCGMNQSYHYSGCNGHKGNTSGNCFTDTPDFCSGPNDIR